jgi:hypothetical protein
MFSDVWGPAPSSVGKFWYYVSFIDDFSKFTWVYLLKNKSDVFHKFHNFQQLVECQFDRKILAIQNRLGGGGGEYQKLTPFFECVGITHHIFCPHTHTSIMAQQNVSIDI